jgi:hypothetical protein
MFCKSLLYEFRRFATSNSVVTLVLGGVILYAILYNFMYLPQVVRRVPIAWVDEAQTSCSRTFARRLETTPQVRIAARYANPESAREALRRGEVEGVVQVPRNFGASAVPAASTPIYIMWGSTASLLTYAAIQEAVNGVALALRSEWSAPSPVKLQVVVLPVGNDTGGYGTYLIPAVLMVILFQTMLMAVGIRLGTDYQERYRPWRWLMRPRGLSMLRAGRIVTARMMVYVGVYAVMSLFVVALVPRLFDLPHRGDALTLTVLMAEYLVATAAFALALAPVFRDSEEPLVYVAFFSVGYLFLSGVSYPLECMPTAWRFVSILFPVCPATRAYVQVNSLGASLGEISSQLLLLAVQAKVYISVAVFGHWRLLKSTSHY